MASSQMKTVGGSSDNNDLKNDLKVWLEENSITYKNINRDFSDGVLVAQLIKKLYPKIIDLHNYQSGNSFQIKLQNWQTLNVKVFSKIGLHQTKASLEKYAKCVSGNIELFLCNLMTSYKNNKPKEEICDKETQKNWRENDEIVIVNVSKKIGDAIIQMPQKMILYSLYEELHQEYKKKDAILNATQQKLTHLENIVKLKTERIDELTGQLTKVSSRNTTKLDMSLDLENRKSKVDVANVNNRVENNKPSVPHLSRINSYTFTTFPDTSSLTTNYGQLRKKAIGKSPALPSADTNEETNEFNTKITSSSQHARQTNRCRSQSSKQLKVSLSLHTSGSGTFNETSSQVKKRPALNPSQISNNSVKHRNCMPKSRLSTPEAKRTQSTPRDI